MSIIKLSSENFQTYKLVANPKRVFASSSESGITGSVALLSDSSPSIKSLDIRKVNGNPFIKYIESNAAGNDENTLIDGVALHKLMELDVYRLFLFNKEFAEAAVHVGGPEPTAELYLQLVNSIPRAVEDDKRQEVIRCLPGARLDKNFNRKRTIKGALFPNYRYKYENLNWAYTNYNSINFFKSSNTPDSSVMIYPAGTGSDGDNDINFYAPSSSFTFDFYIKPKIDNNQTIGSTFEAGTVLHMSSCYAVSIVSGSSYGHDGLPDGFRVLFQLSQSADIAPRDITINGNLATSTYGDDGFVFISDDNSLKRDKWSHVTVRWPGSSVNAGSGSIVVDGNTEREFIITSGTVMQPISVQSSIEDPNALFVGNYYEGSNTGAESISRFFNETAGLSDGLTIFPGTANQDPTGIELRHPLNAEIHDLKIFDQYKSDDQVESMRTTGISELSSDLLFFVPPFFVKESRTRNIFQTPFFQSAGKTDDPFNVSLSFGVGGLEINSENFSREFVRKEYPRFYNITSSMTDTSVYQEGLTANDILYSSGSSLKRLYSILPCDNPNFRPSYTLLETGSSEKSKFVDEFGLERLDLISLENMVSTENLPKGLRSLETLPPLSFKNDGSPVPPLSLEFNESNATFNKSSFAFQLQGASPEDPSVSPGNILTILQRTGDPDSNQVVMFDASNMLYGDRIIPNSLIIEDLNPFGVTGSFTFSLKDNGRGSIYRCDTHDGKGAEWASVGNILYEEGLIVIKSPHLSMIGHNEFKITFEGERSVYVFEVSIPLEENLHNSSSNPQYKSLSPTDNYNETADEFTYITGVQLHDNNLNVVGRAHFAQPYIKREEDRVVVKLRMDF